jgi:hypothetical protein
MPDQRAVSFWQKIASRYQGNPRVVFDLFNEPHDVTSDVWLNGGTVEYKGISYVAVGMRKLYDTVRGTGAKNVVFVSGVSWSGRPSQLAPLQGVTNVVYAAHAYTCPTGLPQDGHACNGPKVPGGNLHPTQIIDRWAPLAAAHPVVFDEFGWPSATDGRYDTNTIAMIAHRHWSGWVAFTLNGSTSGLFNIVRNIGSVENPTIRGMAIMSGLFAN